jgi:transcription elongation factor Elf1
MKKRTVTLRVFQCPTCGVKMVMPKKANRITKNGHLKTLYCYQCKTDKQMVQISNSY